MANRFICYKTLSKFEEDLEDELIPSDAIVICIDSKFLYTDSTYYYWENVVELDETSSRALNNLNSRVKALET